jgi:uncharacterized protein YwgA
MWGTLTIYDLLTKTLDLGPDGFRLAMEMRDVREELKASFFLNMGPYKQALAKAYSNLSDVELQDGFNEYSEWVDALNAYYRHTFK